MPSTIIVGPKGSGKNLFVVMLLEDSKRPIYSNFKIDYPNYHKLDLITMLDLPNDIEFVGDEFYTMVDARNSMSHINQFAGYVSFELRKTNINIYLMMIQLGSVDLRFRYEWDYLVECKRIPNESDDWHFWDFSYTIYNNFLGVVIPVVVLYDDAKPYFKNYNTYEMIKPVNISRLEHAILIKNPELWYERGIEIFNDIKNSIIKFNKKGLKSALARNGYDPIWAEVCDLVLNEQPILN